MMESTSVMEHPGAWIDQELRACDPHHRRLHLRDQDHRHHLEDVQVGWTFIWRCFKITSKWKYTLASIWLRSPGKTRGRNMLQRKTQWLKWSTIGGFAMTCPFILSFGPLQLWIVQICVFQCVVFWTCGQLSSRLVSEMMTNPKLESPVWRGHGCGWLLLNICWYNILSFHRIFPEMANLRWIIFVGLMKSSPQETVDKAQHGDVFQLQHVKSAHSGLLVIVCWAPAFNFVNKHLLLGTMEVFVPNINHVPFIETLTLLVKSKVYLTEFNCAAFEILEKLKQIYTFYVFWLSYL